MEDQQQISPDALKKLRGKHRALLLRQSCKADARLHQVVDRLFIGSVGCALNVAELKESGVTHNLLVSVSVKQQALQGKVPDVTHSVVQVRDASDATVELLKALPACLDFIDRALSTENGSCLICSFRGMSRAYAVLCSYLMYRHGMSLKEANAVLVRARPSVAPNPGFGRALVALEKELCSPVHAEGSGEAHAVATEGGCNTFIDINQAVKVVLSSLSEPQEKLASLPLESDGVAQLPLSTGLDELSAQLLIAECTSLREELGDEERTTLKPSSFREKYTSCQEQFVDQTPEKTNSQDSSSRCITSLSFSISTPETKVLDNLEKDFFPDELCLPQPLKGQDSPKEAHLATSCPPSLNHESIPDHRNDKKQVFQNISTPTLDSSPMPPCEQTPEKTNSKDSSSRYGTSLDSSPLPPSMCKTLRAGLEAARQSLIAQKAKAVQEEKYELAGEIHDQLKRVKPLQKKLEEYGQINSLQKKFEEYDQINSLQKKFEECGIIPTFPSIDAAFDSGKRAQVAQVATAAVAQVATAAVLKFHPVQHAQVATTAVASAPSLEGRQPHLLSLAQVRSKAQEALLMGAKSGDLQSSLQSISVKQQLTQDEDPSQGTDKKDDHRKWRLSKNSKPDSSWIRSSDDEEAEGETVKVNPVCEGTKQGPIETTTLASVSSQPCLAAQARSCASTPHFGPMAQPESQQQLQELTAAKPSLLELPQETSAVSQEQGEQQRQSPSKPLQRHRKRDKLKSYIRSTFGTRSLHCFGGHLSESAPSIDSENRIS